MTAVLSVPADEDWIVCLGATRIVRDGLVTCVGTGTPQVRLDACLACRHLEWRRDERERAAACAIGNPSR